MKRWFVVAALCLSAVSSASGIDGWGRMSIGGGYRWLPNWWFQGRAASPEVGTPVAMPTLDGGPQGTASFGLGVNSLLEVSVDLLFGYHSFALNTLDGGRDEFSSISAGALIGARLVGNDVFFKGFMPYLSIQAGPVLSAITARSVMVPEKVLGGLSASGGATYRINHKYGLTLEVRYLQARNAIPGISGINVGGVWFTAMFTIFFPPELKRDLDVPGF